MSRETLGQTVIRDAANPVKSTGGLVVLKGNLAPEEDSLLLDLLGKLKMTYLEVNQAVAAQAAQQAKAKSRS